MKINPMRSTVCGAKTRAGHPCKARPVATRRRCRMHGGAAGSGAPRANQNALKHGWYTAESRLLRFQARQQIKQLRQLSSDCNACNAK